MFHHPPALPYKGLTIIMSNPSRFDTRQLLSGNAGDWFCNKLLKENAGVNRFNCDIYDLEGFNSAGRELRAESKVILLLGERAHQSITGLDTSLGEHRGSPTFYRGIPCIATYLPQDAFDPVNHESRLNSQAGDYDNDDSDSDDDEDSDSDAKSRHGRTKRSNYRFWLSCDLSKVGRILANDGQLFSHPKPDYRIYPSASEAIEVLNSYENTDFYFDLENDTEYNVNCFGFSFGDDNPVYTLPLLRWDYTIAYTQIGEIMRALVRAMSRNRVIAHNGSGHDFIIMPWKYGIPWGSRLADTMIMTHRCIVGNTLIQTVSSEIAIKDLVDKSDFHVWSWKDGKQYPAKVKRVFKTQENAKVIRVNCWRRKFGGVEKFHIDCTPDHKFLVHEKWIEAKDLLPRMRLTRVHIDYTDNPSEYHSFTDWSKKVYGKKVTSYKAHRYIWECLNGAIPDNHEIHHKDENKHNNEPDNLECKTKSDHRYDHISNDRFRLGNWVKKNGSHRKGKFLIQLDVGEVTKLYNSGMSQKSIAKIMKCDQALISIFMRANKIPIRTLKQAQQLRRESEYNCKVISVEELSDLQDVYCMEVEDTQCFSANGVIVHNCFPMVEKSLGHTISLFTDLPYHKDEGVFMPQNTQQEQSLWQYNAKDVYAMREVKKGIDAYAATQPGLTASIQQANDSLVPYLTTVLQGMLYDDDKVQSNLKTNDRILNGLLRLLTAAVGSDKLEEIRGSGESSMPSSSTQCVRYFHYYCGYPVQGYGKVRKSTGKREPSLNEKNFLKLVMKLEDKGVRNPVVDIVLGYRSVAKESSMLRFELWTGVKQLR